MRTRVIRRIGLCTAVAVSLSGGLAAQRPDSAAGGPVPALLTPAALREGRAVYRGTGNCVACHGARLEGGAIAPPLIAHTWRNGDGSFAMILRVVTTGVPNTAMLPFPGGISPDQARRVAAYVWAVGHGATRP
jgi:mono/diheme cytochrome c family protein